MTHRSQKPLRQMVLSAMAGLAMLASGALTQAATIFDSQGFESSAGYSTTFLGTGQLEGQVPGPQPFMRAGGPTSIAVVQNSVVGSGGQAVQIDRAAGESLRMGVEVAGYPSLPIVVVDFDMRVTQSLGAGDFGPFFGAEAYDGVGFSATGLLGSVGVDSKTGDVLYQEAGTGFLAEAGLVVPFNAWRHYRMILDFTNNVYSVEVNNVALVTNEGFVDGAALDQFSDAPLATFAAAGDAASQANPGQAFFDNYMVREFSSVFAVPPATLIPEPGACMLACIAGGALLGLRRRSR